MIPLFSAAAVHEGLDLRAPLLRVLDRQWFVLGEEVRAFEDEFAAWCGVPHAVSLANGTDALELALRAVGVRAGDEVLCAANAGFYGSTAALAMGALPRYAEVSERSLTLDPASVRAELTRRRPAAVIVTHLYGQLADMAALVPLCREAGVPLVEDCAQAHGARWDGRRAGAFADIGCFSFYPTKNLGAIGDAGMVVTDDEAIAAQLKLLRQYGWEKPQYSLVQGWNSRLDPLQAAILSVKLKHLDAQTARRRELADRYAQRLKDLPLVLPGTRSDCAHAYHLYVAELADERTREALREHLAAHGIIAGIHYPFGVHEQPAYKAWIRTGSMVVTERLARTVLSLPLYPELSDADQSRVCDAVRSFFQQ